METLIGELKRKAGLWDKAEAMIKRMFELFSDADKPTIKDFAGNDKETTPTTEVKSWRGVFSRLARMAGVIKGRER